MRLGFYRRLAWQGIRKNRRLYTPYLLTCAVMVMIQYIMEAISQSPVLLLDQVGGGNVAADMMRMGSGVMTVFSFVFLFYTNSFLIRQRKKEFGLYNILGMGKWSIGRILLWDGLIVALLSMAAGLFSGLVLSKFFELVLIHMIHGQVSYAQYVSWEAVGDTLLVFAVIFSVIFLNSLRQVHTVSPVALLRSESTGEKPPKANWFLGLLGALGLAGGYGAAVLCGTLRGLEPNAILSGFFLAVLVVIVSTYLVFIAGSVVLCRLLQKKKGYYYQANHFVSVSSMAFRMKRNGAGLASICILLTMVLVTVSSTAALYFGFEDNLITGYTSDFTIKAGTSKAVGITDEVKERFDAVIREALDESGTVLKGSRGYRIAGGQSTLTAGCVEMDYGNMEEGPDGIIPYLNLRLLQLSDYNALTRQSLTLDMDEALVYPQRMAYSESAVTINGSRTYRVKSVLDTIPQVEAEIYDEDPVLWLVVPDISAAVAPLLEEDGDSLGLWMQWWFCLDFDSGNEAQLHFAERIREKTRAYREVGFADWDLMLDYVQLDSRAESRQWLLGYYGGLLAMGGLLSVVFLFAAVLILYYKQISEGYEDQARFAIMQKVGMTKKEIRRSINSQMLTVFSLPLLTAGCHLLFAFPVIGKLLTFFGLMNWQFFTWMTLACFALFALFYALVYRGTARVYYRIVSGSRDTGE